MRRPGRRPAPARGRHGLRAVRGRRARRDGPRLRRGLVAGRRPRRGRADRRPGGRGGAARRGARRARPRRPRRAGRAGAHGLGHRHGLVRRAVGPRAGARLELPHRGRPAPRRRWRRSRLGAGLGTDPGAPAARRPPAARADHHAGRARAGRRPVGRAAAVADPRRLRAARPPAGGRPAEGHRRARRGAGAARAVDHPADDHRRGGTHAGRPRLHRRRPAGDRLPDGQERHPRPARCAVHHLGALARAGRRLRPSGAPRRCEPASPPSSTAHRGWSVAVVDAAGGTVATLAEEAPKPGSTVAVAMDRALQAAAEDAVEPLPQQAMLVAIQPSTGNLLAVARTARPTPPGPWRSPAGSRRVPRSRS